MKSKLVGVFEIILNPIWILMIYLGLIVTTLHLELDFLKTVHLELIVFCLSWAMVLLDLKAHPSRYLANRLGLTIASFLALSLIALPLATSLVSNDYLNILNDGEFKSYTKILLLAPLIYYYLSQTNYLRLVLDILNISFALLGIYLLYRYYILQEARVFDGRPLLKIRHGDPNFLCTFFAMILPLSLMQAYQAYSDKRLVRLGAYFVQSCYLFSLILITQSRMGFIVTALGLLFLSTRRFKSSSKSYMLRLISVFVVIGLMLGAAFSTDILSRFSQINDKSSLDRLLTYQNGVKVFIDNPFFGVGMHKAKESFYYNSKYPHFQSEFGPLEIHNTFLNVLAELGIVGVAVFIALYLWSGISISSANSEQKNFLIASFLILFLSGLTIGISYKDLALVQLFILAGLAKNRGESNVRA